MEWTPNFAPCSKTIDIEHRWNVIVLDDEGLRANQQSPAAAYERLALQAEEHVARLTLRKKDMSSPGVTHLQLSRLAASKQAKTAEDVRCSRRGVGCRRTRRRES